MVHLKEKPRTGAHHPGSRTPRWTDRDHRRTCRGGRLTGNHLAVAGQAVILPACRSLRNTCSAQPAAHLAFRWPSSRGLSTSPLRMGDLRRRSRRQADPPIGETLPNAQGGLGGRVGRTGYHPGPFPPEPAAYIRRSRRVAIAPGRGFSLWARSGTSVA
jgi:hypothetical protein